MVNDHLAYLHSKVEWMQQSICPQGPFDSKYPFSYDFEKNWFGIFGENFLILCRCCWKFFSILFKILSGHCVKIFCVLQIIFLQHCTVNLTWERHKKEYKIPHEICKWVYTLWMSCYMKIFSYKRWNEGQEKAASHRDASW